MYGLVEGELMWAWDLAAFGNDLQSYLSARLTRA
ncbi:MAG: heme-binding beta-barrel domain-containing protein [Demequina sp.]